MLIVALVCPQDIKGNLIMTIGKINKIEKLKKQREVINARIQKMEALETSRERKKDTRRKILVGAYYLDKAKEDDAMHEINIIMGSYLTRKSDRILFDLSDKSEDK
jgi:large subunit ribosomal protein L7/L12